MFTKEAMRLLDSGCQGSLHAIPSVGHRCNRTRCRSGLPLECDFCWRRFARRRWASYSFWGKQWSNKLHRREIGQATQPDGCERICNKQHHSILCHRQEQSLNRLTSQTYRDLPKQNSNPGWNPIPKSDLRIGCAGRPCKMKRPAMAPSPKTKTKAVVVSPSAPPSRRLNFKQPEVAQLHSSKTYWRIGTKDSEGDPDMRMTFLGQWVLVVCVESLGIARSRYMWGWQSLTSATVIRR